jgi:hypothetical protein
MQLKLFCNLQQLFFVGLGDIKPGKFALIDGFFHDLQFSRKLIYFNEKIKKGLYPTRGITLLPFLQDEKTTAQNWL